MLQQTTHTLRRAFDEASRRARSIIGKKVWPDRSDAYRRVELSRVLAGERRVPWSLLEATLEHGDPEPILSAVAARAGYRVERVTRIEPERGALEQLSQLAAEIERIRAGLTG